MSDSSSTLIKLNIKLSDGTKSSFEISPSSEIKELKELVSKELEVPVERLRLIFAGKVLKDENTVESYSLKNDHTIHVVKGAAPQAKDQTPKTSETTTDAGNFTYCYYLFYFIIFIFVLFS